LRIEKTRHKLHQSTLARAARADQRDHFARRDIEADLLQNRFVRFVAETNVFESNAPFQSWQTLRVGLLLHVRLDVEDFEDAVNGGQRVVENCVHLADAVDGKIQLAQQV